MARRTITASRGCGMAETVTAVSAGKVGAVPVRQVPAKSHKRTLIGSRWGGGRRKK